MGVLESVHSSASPFHGWNFKIKWSAWSEWFEVACPIRSLPMDTSVLSIQQAARGDGLSRFKRGLSRPLHHALRRCWCSSALWQTSQAWFGLTGPGSVLFISAQVHTPFCAGHEGVLCWVPSVLSFRPLTCEFSFFLTAPRECHHE